METNKIIPIEDIGTLAYQPLVDRKIVLGVTGSSSIYRSIDLARKLIRMGASVRVVMTRFAAKLISPDLFHWATGSKPYIEMTGETEHIDLAKWGDAMVIAPATLNTMSKIAYGILDELVALTATTMLGAGKKVIIVPAMNIRLYNSPQYREASSILEKQGVVVYPPLIVEDKAKYPPIDDLLHCIDAIINRGLDARDLRILVTAGATREYIDPVRVITNPSSGLMGILIAREAACRGGKVTLVHGDVRIDIPYLVEKIYTDTTDDMSKEIHELTKRIQYDITIFSAAPADYKPKVTNNVKIPSRLKSELVIELVSTSKVIKSVYNRPRIVVGFAAETAAGDILLEKAREKLVEYSLDLIVANNIISELGGFGKEFLEAVIMDKTSILKKGILTKYEIARIVMDYSITSLRNKLINQ
ncbi:MAG: bifunctional phosphopantothenoylcysteine decarboxylase/phosphopantothenate--cysteine ligase CoaBC [Desulfurococcaceae archaeon]